MPGCGAHLRVAGVMDGRPHLFHNLPSPPRLLHRYRYQPVLFCDRGFSPSTTHLCYVIRLSALYTCFIIQYTPCDSWPCSDWPLASNNWQLSIMSRSACSISLLLLARASHAYSPIPSQLISPILTHLVLRVALPPSVPSTYHYHYPSPLHAFIPDVPFLQILPTVAFLLFFRTDSMDHPDCLPILLSISVFTF